MPWLFAARAQIDPVTPGSVAGDSADGGCNVRHLALAARLKSVSTQNVPKSLKGVPRKRTAPAEKPIPKKAPRILKRYKLGWDKRASDARVSVMLARIRKIVALRPSNVISLVSAIEGRVAEALDQRRRAA